MTLSVTDMHFKSETSDEENPPLQTAFCDMIPLPDIKALLPQERDRLTCIKPMTEISAPMQTIPLADNPPLTILDFAIDATSPIATVPVIEQLSPMLPLPHVPKSFEMLQLPRAINDEPTKCGPLTDNWDPKVPDPVVMKSDPM